MRGLNHVTGGGLIGRLSVGGSLFLTARKCSSFRIRQGKSDHVIPNSQGGGEIICDLRYTPRFEFCPAANQTSDPMSPLVSWAIGAMPVRWRA